MTTNLQYFIGFGAQKAGTSWLHSYLESHPDVALPPLKEVHFWSSIYVAHQRFSGIKPREFLRRATMLAPRALTKAEARRWIANYVRVVFHNRRAYREFLDLRRGTCAIAGEITPAYSCLPQAGFAEMDALLHQPRYVFLMRNPADRFISQIGQEAKRRSGVLKADPLGDLLHRPSFQLRSGYRRTVEACRKTVPEDRLLVLFYENLFDPELGQQTCDQICTFLGVAPHPAPLEQRVNVRKVKQTEVDRDALARALAGEYLFAAERYAETLPASWAEDIARLGLAEVA